MLLILCACGTIDPYCAVEFIYRSVPGKRPLPGKHPCTEFQGVTVTVAASIQTYGIYIPGKRPCALTWDTTVLYMRPMDHARSEIE